MTERRFLMSPIRGRACDRDLDEFEVPPSGGSFAESATLAQIHATGHAEQPQTDKFKEVEENYLQ